MWPHFHDIGQRKFLNRITYYILKNLVQQYHKGNDTYTHSPQRKVNKQHVSQLEKDRNLNIIVMHVHENEMVTLYQNSN